ncbi:MAG: hypothetical protein HY590_06000 [Candidatus Omnitrophica bacterium]|nr:hypothetical protein [Candidatus Omnitrophota bacterium]
MSLINEALKKAEKEKAKPNLFGVQSFEEPLSKKPKKWKKGLFLLLGIGICGALSVGVFVLNAPKKTSLVKNEPSPVTPVAPAEQKVSEEPSPPPAPTPTPLRSIPIAMDGSFILNGIVEGKGENVAIINNRITRVGDETDGAVLLEVGKDSVLLKKEGKKFFLKMR